MTTPFPESASYSGYDAPSRIEADLFDLEIVGDLPPLPGGTWYRCGPDPQYPPLHGDDFFLSGDGMMSMFRFADGHVDYRSRYVRTPRFLAERAARRRLFGDYRNPFTDDPSVRGVDRAQVNTSAFWHAGRLFALKEDSRPYEVHPDTLETRGVFDWNGALRSLTVTAHPKVDPVSGEMLFFGYEAGGLATRDIAFCAADAQGRLIREEWFEAPYCAMVHDFAITRDYVIFPLYPTIADLERMKLGGPHWMSDMAQPTHIAIMPRKGTVADIRWFRHRGCHAYHVINAWNDGTRVYLDQVLAQINPFPFIPDVSGAPYDLQKAVTIPTRWSFDFGAAGDTLDERPLARLAGDIPRIDERRLGLPYRFAYLGGVDPAQAMHKTGPVGGGFNLVCKLDVRSGVAETWHGNGACTFQEPLFVPAGEGEDDGYVLCVIDRHDENRSDVGVFDARSIARGPLALIRLPIRLRLAIHGCWVGASAPA
jgi:carotenoid cleavage dioxygenase